MKKIYSFLFAAVALVSAASCQKELANDNATAVEGEKFTITAVADAQTKTALASDGKSSGWTPGDAIAVFDVSGNGTEFTTDITANQTSAKFTCETFEAPESFVALYPYQADLTLADGTVSGLEFPAVQQALAGGFDKDAAFTFAKGDDKDNLVFDNLYSLLKVTIAEEGITEVTVSATSGSLAGKVTLNSADGTFAVVDGQGSSSVTLTGEFTKDATYYICVLPGEYEGFSIALNGYTVKTKASAATLAANTVYDLGEVEYPLAKWGIKGNFEGGNDWTTLMQMKDNGSTWYFLKGVTFTGTPEFKFNKSDDTGWWLGVTEGYSVTNNNTSNYLTGDKNIKPSLDNNVCDIYLSLALGKFYVSTDGSKPTDPTSYYLTGDAVGGWGNQVELNKVDDGIYKATDVSITSGEIKVKIAESWDESYGHNNNGTPVVLKQDGSSNEIWFNSGNAKVETAGTYDVIFSLKEHTLTFNLK